jgi:hypothetical protein
MFIIIAKQDRFYFARFDEPSGADCMPGGVSP